MFECLPAVVAERLTVQVMCQALHDLSTATPEVDWQQSPAYDRGGDSKNDPHAAAHHAQQSTADGYSKPHSRGDKDDQSAHASHSHGHDRRVFHDESTAHRDHSSSIPAGVWPTAEANAHSRDSHGHHEQSPFMTYNEKMYSHNDQTFHEAYWEHPVRTSASFSKIKSNLFWILWSGRMLFGSKYTISIQLSFASLFTADHVDWPTCKYNDNRPKLIYLLLWENILQITVSSRCLMWFWTFFHCWLCRLTHLQVQWQQGPKILLLIIQTYCLDKSVQLIFNLIMSLHSLLTM